MLFFAAFLFSEFMKYTPSRNCDLESRLEKETSMNCYDAINDPMLKKGYVLLNQEDKKIISEYDKELRRTRKTSPEIISNLERIGINISLNPDFSKEKSFSYRPSAIKKKLIFDKGELREYVKQEIYEDAKEFYRRNNI